MSGGVGGVVVGVGIDVAETRRFERLVRRGGGEVSAHWYTEAEAQECARRARPGLAAATRFAVKEATYKAVGARFIGAVRWRDIEVLEGGSTWHLSLHGEVAAAAGAAGAEQFHISTCQTGRWVMATVIAQGHGGTARRTAPANVSVLQMTKWRP